MLPTNLRIVLCVPVLIAGLVLTSYEGPVAAQASAEKPGEKPKPPENPKGEPKKETTPQASGIVKAVDAAKNTVTITGKATQEQTYSVTANAGVEIDGKAAKLSDVPVGAGVVLQLTPTVRNLLAVGPHVSGKVDSVDTTKNTIAVKTKGAQTLEVAKDARILIDGKPGKLADLKEDMVVDVRLGADKKAVVAIMAGEMVSTGGIVKSVDADKAGITVSVKGEKGLEENTVTVSKDVTIEIDGKPAKLKDLSTTAHVALKLSKDHKTVYSIQATTGQHHVGEVKSVDAGKNTIVVTFKGQDQTYTLPSGAGVDIDGKSGKLADVPVGSQVILHMTATVVSVKASKAKNSGK